MRLITPETSAHWYTLTGEPRYDATLREARKENLLPSVTSITKLWPKGALENWKQTQFILAALTLPRMDGETDDAFAKRVVTDGQSQAKTTAAWGTTMHELIEEHHAGKTTGMFVPQRMLQHYQHYVQWFKDNIESIIKCEAIVTHPFHGYAGKLDVLAQFKGYKTYAIGDIKSRSIKDGKPLWYDEQPMQLVAYAECLPVETTATRFFSVIINRDTPEPPYVRWWTADEIATALENFLCLLALWKRVNRYESAVPKAVEAVGEATA